ncbi:hypothetical protein [Gordonibacter sp. 28C]|uniref:hypothetical protein n=1 Tax=Gordonibacter sp. 28C TaxID=2078569 RepID=UPI001313FE96|nr:hypothetical protein [Gordonibacter sp. 28C]
MIVVPFFSPWHAPLVEAALSAAGRPCRVPAAAGEDVVRAGLETVNNDACYAALLAAGRAMSLLREPRSGVAADPVRVIVPTPCVFCRGDDAPYLVAHALDVAGLGEGVGVLGADEALDALAGDVRAVELVADAVALGDVLLQTRLRVRPYLGADGVRGLDDLLSSWREKFCKALSSEERIPFESVLDSFDDAVAGFGVPERDGRPVVGVVGTVPAVFDEGMNAGLAACVEREGCEAALPYLLPLAAYALQEKGVAGPLRTALDDRCVALRSRAANGFPCPTVQDLEHAAADVVPGHLVQGAGWTIAGYARLFVRAGVGDLVYVRAFGCLAGHVVGQGALKPLRALCAAEGEDVNLATIEFDPGTSEVNQVNRIKLLTAVAKRAAKRRRNP